VLPSTNKHFFILVPRRNDASSSANVRLY